MDALHIHLALSHVPVLGAVFGTAILAAALLTKKEDVAKTALTLFVVAAACAVPVYLTGEASEGVATGLPGALRSVLEIHEEAAEAATAGVAALGLASLALLAFFRTPKRLPTGPLIAVLLLSIVACGLLARAANRGGAIRHTEIRDAQDQE